MEWSERVAVVPIEEPEDERVLYSLNLKSERGLKLVLLANDIKMNKVLAVQTRAMGREEREQEEHDRAMIAVEQLTVEQVFEKDEVESVREEESELTLFRQEEESELRDLVVELNSSAEGDEEVLFELRKGKQVGKNLVELPPAEKGKSRDRLVKETKADPSLQPWRQLADREDKGFSWDHDCRFRALPITCLRNVSWL